MVLAVALITLVNIWTSLSHSSGEIGSLRAMEEASLRSALSQSISFSKSAESQQQQQQQQQQPVELQDLEDPRGVPVPRKPPLDSTASSMATTTTTTTTTKPRSVRVPESTRTSPLPPVQGWPDRGDVKPPRMTPPTDRQLYESLDDINIRAVQAHLEAPSLRFDNSTINPVLPSFKVAHHPLTMWNIEIPSNYSIQAPMTSTIPWSNCTTLAFYEGRLRSGFRNQIMAFVILILEANHPTKGKQQHSTPHGQFLLRSLGQKDTYGTNSFIPFASLWDVPHWNSHYPRLPRLVDYDPILHSQFNFDNARWYRTPTFANTTNTTSINTTVDDFSSAPTRILTPPAGWFGTYGLFATPKPQRPHGYGFQHKLMAAYTHYAKGKGRYTILSNDNTTTTTAKSSRRNPAEILMLQGAMRPHPDLQAILDRLLIRASLLQPNESTATSNYDDVGNDGSSTVPLQLDYMTLHARVEPDMQKHKVCRDKKVLNLTDIFEFIQAKWKDPPVSTIFMPINRQYLELEGDIYNQANSSRNGNGAKMNLPGAEKKKKRKSGQQINWIAVENLKALNRARDEGLWSGRAQVLEFGASALEGTSYADKPSTAGAMVNFFIGVPAKIFIGTEVSSFSHDLVATRFFRGYSENYKYLPSGLHDWTPRGTVDPPGFAC
jgi:hypothetical protein